MGITGSIIAGDPGLQNTPRRLRSMVRIPSLSGSAIWTASSRLFRATNLASPSAASARYTSSFHLAEFGIFPNPGLHRPMPAAKSA